jgi:hypothetical protein
MDWRCVTQESEHLLYNHEALRSNPSPTSKETKVLLGDQWYSGDTARRKTSLIQKGLKNIVVASSPFLHHQSAHTWLHSLLCLLTRLSESNYSKIRNKSKSLRLPSGFRWKLVIKPATTSRRDTEGPHWVYKDLHVNWHTYLYCITATIILPY